MRTWFQNLWTALTVKKSAIFAQPLKVGEPAETEAKTRRTKSRKKPHTAVHKP